MKCLKCLQKPCSWIPKRYFMAIYALIGLNVFYWMRVSMNLALSQMCFRAPEPDKTNNTGSQYCPPAEKYAKTENTKAEFHWDQSIQHLILAGFYIGYLLSNIPGGMLSDTFGGKSVFGFGFLLSTIANLLFPFLARLGYVALFIGRIVQGIGQGVILPSLSSMVAKWTPPNERSAMTGITQSGVLFGNASAFIVSGFILSVIKGWQEIFYINGALGLVWVFGWYLLCYSSPAEHPFISEKEKNMIESQINMKKKPKSIPWKKMLTSPPVYAAMIANYGHLWANFTMINEMPVYLNRVINFDIKNSGVFSATPHISMIPTAIGAGYLCDWLVTKHIMSITFNRKLFIFFSNALPVPFLIAASYVGCDKTWVVILFAIMMFFKGLSYPTLKAQPVDLAPHYAGILMGILNGTGSIAGFVSPNLVPLFLTGDGTLTQWRNFFILTGVVMVISTFPFFCFGSAKVQPWNFQEEDEEGAADETTKKDGGETSDRPKEP